MKITKVYKDGECIPIHQRRERRTAPRHTWPYYLAIIAFAIVMALVIADWIFGAAAVTEALAAGVMRI